MDNGSDMHNDPSNAAPGALEAVRRFVDTDDIYNGRDALADVTAATEWLVAEGMLDKGPSMTAPDLSVLRNLRDALRTMAAPTPWASSRPTGPSTRSTASPHGTPPRSASTWGVVRRPPRWSRARTAPGVLSHGSRPPCTRPCSRGHGRG